jgi:hypothetical protein
VVTNGISVNTNNLGNEPVDLGYAWHLLNGSTNFLLDVTNPAFTNGHQPNVTIQIIYYENSDGHLSVWYDSTNGLKLGATYTLYSTNSQWDTKSFPVTDARFSATNDIILTVDSTNCDPIVRLVRVDTASYLGVPQQILPTQFTGTLSILSPSLQGQTNLVLSGNVGSANGGLSYSVWGTTNLVVPSNQWSLVITNVFFNANGSFSNALPIMPGMPRMFYRLRVP